LLRIGPPDHSAKTHRNPLLPGDKEAGFAGAGIGIPGRCCNNFPVSATKNAFFDSTKAKRAA
jgi:hypothetical protein